MDESDDKPWGDRLSEIPETLRKLADHDPLVHTAVTNYMSDRLVTLTEMLVLLVVAQSELNKRLQAAVLRVDPVNPR